MINNFSESLRGCYRNFDGLGNNFTGNESGMYRIMKTLDFQHIYQTRAVADDYYVSFSYTVRLAVARNSIKSALGNHLCAGFNDLSVINKLIHKRVILKVCERILRIKIEFLPVKPDDHTNRNTIIAV